MNRHQTRSDRAQARARGRALLRFVRPDVLAQVKDESGFKLLLRLAYRAFRAGKITHTQLRMFGGK